MLVKQGKIANDQSIHTSVIFRSLLLQKRGNGVICPCFKMARFLCRPSLIKITKKKKIHGVSICVKMSNKIFLACLSNS